jgi:D-galactose 1-dehydrogenase
MPPQFRYAAARTALEAGKHVFLEKPPGATLSEVADLQALADSKGLSLFASWHSRYAPAVEAAKAFLASTKINDVKVIWKEDVRHWHPNQDWIWAAGGLGVFDPGINALSIVTHILPNPMFITSATLEFPENRAPRSPPRSPSAMPTTCRSRPNSTGARPATQSWDIVAETEAGMMVLSEGGAKLSIDGKLVHDEPEQEYPALYALRRHRQGRHLRRRSRAAAPCRRCFHARTAQIRRCVFRLSLRISCTIRKAAERSAARYFDAGPSAAQTLQAIFLGESISTLHTA